MLTGHKRAQINDVFRIKGIATRKKQQAAKTSMPVVTTYHATSATIILSEKMAES
jgi:hypothetical protein